MAESVENTSQLTKDSEYVPKQSTSVENVNVDLAGANMKHNHLLSSTSSHNKRPTLHWFACIGSDAEEGRSESTEERDKRLRVLRDRQNEERQKRLEELKAQALAEQQYREQKDEERRRRIEEMRLRENDRRQQVGERKRLINEAERDRRESILKKNMERDARFELKRRNERSSIAFAFGSSTPRMILESNCDSGNSSFWGHRRATSINNIVFTAAGMTNNVTNETVPALTRRSSERELDIANKKRATSASGIDRANIGDKRMSTSMYEIIHRSELPGTESSPCPQINPQKSDGPPFALRSLSSHLFGNDETIAAGCVSGHLGRRRTDLMPTIPISVSSSSSLSIRKQQPFTRSPGRTYSLSRLDQLAKPRTITTTIIKRSPTVYEHVRQNKPHSQSKNIKSMSRSMGHLAAPLSVSLRPQQQQQQQQQQKLVPQRPLRKVNSKSMHQLSASGGANTIVPSISVPPVPPPRTTRAFLLRKRVLEMQTQHPSEGPSRPGSSLSQQSTNSVSSAVVLRQRTVSTPRKPRPISIAVTGVTNELIQKKSDDVKPPLPRARKMATPKAENKNAKSMKHLVKVTQSPSVQTATVDSIAAEPINVLSSSSSSSTTTTTTTTTTEIQMVNVENKKESENKIDSASSSYVIVPLQRIDDTPVAKVSLSSSHENVMETTNQKSCAENDESLSLQQQLIDEDLLFDTSDMTASMIAKVRITTEEEAKAALAERRRMVREEAERQAEAERLRIEEETRREQEQQRHEEEQLRLLADQQRYAEEERLALAIKETQKREEEEKLRREEELKQKIEKEELERKAREESEKQRIEMQERLKKEEKEREERRKRVEAIMLRTRAGKGNGGTPLKDYQNAINEGDPIEGTKTLIESTPTIELYEKTTNEKEAALFNGSYTKNLMKENGESEQQLTNNSNGHVTEEFSRNNKVVNNMSVFEHNVTNALIDMNEPFKNSNSMLNIDTDKITNEDNVNSNQPNESQATTVCNNHGYFTHNMNVCGTNMCIDLFSFNTNEYTMDACFNAFDKNGDGRLDFNEFQLICQALFRNDKGKIYSMDECKVKDVFSVFDQNNDGFIDRNEFIFCWNHWIKIIVRPISVFLIVDVQNDFISGTLNISNCSAQQNGIEVVEPINRLLNTVEYDAVFYSLDWHPSDHVSFIDNIAQREIHPLSPVTVENAKTYDTVIFAGPPPMKQRLWPKHCVQDTWGSELHSDLKIVDNAIKVYKGTNPDVDSYSVFWDNKKLTNTILCDQLRLKNATDLYICGLAYDVCVGATAIDALTIGYRTILLDDCSRGVDLLEIEKTKNTVIKNNGVIVNSNQAKAMVEGRDRRPELGYKLAMELKNISS